MTTFLATISISLGFFISVNLPSDTLKVMSMMAFCTITLVLSIKDIVDSKK